MPEYLAPGVYIEEIERGPKPIEGVATSTAAFLGETERGPTEPRLVTNYNAYVRLFGEAVGPGKFLPYAVRGFFDNGGRRVYVARIIGENAVVAQAPLSGLVINPLIGGGDLLDGQYSVSALVIALVGSVAVLLAVNLLRNRELR